MFVFCLDNVILTAHRSSDIRPAIISGLSAHIQAHTKPYRFENIEYVHA